MNVTACPATALEVLRVTNIEEIKKPKRAPRPKRTEDDERFAKNTAYFWQVLEYALYLSEFYPICACANGDPDARPSKRTAKISEFLVDVWKLSKKFLEPDVNYEAWEKLLKYGHSQDSADLAGIQANLIQQIGAEFRKNEMKKYFWD